MLTSGISSSSFIRNSYLHSHDNNVKDCNYTITWHTFIVAPMNNEAAILLLVTWYAQQIHSRSCKAHRSIIIKIDSAITRQIEWNDDGTPGAPERALLLVEKK